jgi:hypothetical protein
MKRRDIFQTVLILFIFVDWLVLLLFFIFNATIEGLNEIVIKRPSEGADFVLFVLQPIIVIKSLVLIGSVITEKTFKATTAERTSVPIYVKRFKLCVILGISVILGLTLLQAYGLWSTGIIILFFDTVTEKTNRKISTQTKRITVSKIPLAAEFLENNSDTSNTGEEEDDVEEQE